MLVTRNQLHEVFYNVILKSVIFENEEKTVKMSDFNKDRTVVSSSSFRNNRSFKRAKNQAKKISPERRGFIDANLDLIDPNVYYDDLGNPVSDLTDDERVYYIFKKADKIQKDFAEKAKKKAEMEMAQEIERIKARYASNSDDDTKTYVKIDSDLSNDEFSPDDFDTFY